MPRPRTPRARAEVSGRAAHDPQRFRDRPLRVDVAPVGEPYKTMNPAERAVWKELSESLPWLNRSHRVLLRLACHHAARLDDVNAEFGVSATQALGSLLSKLGATPVDECRVAEHGDDDPDPSERFFRRPN